jgi:Raf kinase inhibitor-like YbhB/YbcL family protein
MVFALSDMTLSSSAFENGERIPREYSGEGDNISPPLHWRDVPDGTRAFAVICHDPDAPLISANGTYGFVHWVLYNIPGDARGLDPGTERYTAGRNDRDAIGYTGPMAPIGHGSHHYFFWVIALDEDIDLPDGLTLWELLQRIEPHAIGMNRLVGTYSRA